MSKIQSPLIILSFLILWEMLFHILDIKWYLLPPPTMILESIISNFSSLMGSLAITIKVTLTALAASVLLVHAWQ